jgi:hypothetical protein
MNKNWKTTVIALAAAALNLYANGVTGKQLLLSVALAAFGAVAKDHNVTGGIVEQ